MLQLGYLVKALNVIANFLESSTGNSELSHTNLLRAADNASQDRTSQDRTSMDWQNLIRDHICGLISDIESAAKQSRYKERQFAIFAFRSTSWGPFKNELQKIIRECFELTPKPHNAEYIQEWAKDWLLMILKIETRQNAYKRASEVRDEPANKFATEQALIDLENTLNDAYNKIQTQLAESVYQHEPFKPLLEYLSTYWEALNRTEHLTQQIDNSTGICFEPKSVSNPSELVDHLSIGQPVIISIERIAGTSWRLVPRIAEELPPVERKTALAISDAIVTIVKNQLSNTFSKQGSEDHSDVVDNSLARSRSSGLMISG